MFKQVLFAGLICILIETTGLAASDFETDVIKTAKGDLQITFIGHGTLMFEFDGKTIHVDPVSRYADYSHMPKADVILVSGDAYVDHPSFGMALIGRLLADTPVRLVHLVMREQGLIVPKGNPMALTQLADLKTSQARFVDRQAEAGSRLKVALDGKDFRGCDAETAEPGYYRVVLEDPGSSAASTAAADGLGSP
mgnify:CR=1 FL=1